MFEHYTVKKIVPILVPSASFYIAHKIYFCDQIMSKRWLNLCLKSFACSYDINILKCIFVHVDPCRSSSLCANKCGHKGGGSQVIHSPLHLPYTEIIIAEQFSFATYAWSWAYAAICLLSHFMSPMFSLLFFFNSPSLLDDVQSAWCNVLASTH